MCGENVWTPKNYLTSGTNGNLESKKRVSRVWFYRKVTINGVVPKRAVDGACFPIPFAYVIRFESYG